MKRVVIFLGLLAFVAADKYSTENDNLDIEALVANNDALQSFIDCFLDLKPCDEVQADFKKDLPEAIKQSCAKCTDAQKHILNRFLAVIKVKLPQAYEALKNKYDSDGKHFAALEQAIANS